jgi:hypothetical protein
MSNKMGLEVAVEGNRLVPELLNKVVKLDLSAQGPAVVVCGE